MAKSLIAEPNKFQSLKTAYLYGGPPVVGKDAQTDACEGLGIPVFKTGPALKKIAQKNPGGPEDLAIKRGDLADDGTTLWVAKTWIIGNRTRKILKLNGIPRKVTQMQIIEFLRERGFNVNVIWFTTPPEVCLARPHRPDRPEDTPENRKRRMEVYEKETLPVLNGLTHYGISEQQGNLLCIDNAKIQKHQVAEKIIAHFALPYRVHELFPQALGREQVRPASN